MHVCSRFWLCEPRGCFKAMDRGSVKHSWCGLALIVLVRRPRRSVGDSSLDHLVLCACSFVFCVRVWVVRTDPVT